MVLNFRWASESLGWPIAPLITGPHSEFLTQSVSAGPQESLAISWVIQMLPAKWPHFENPWNRVCEMWQIKEMRYVIEVGQEKGEVGRQGCSFPCPIGKSIWECCTFHDSSGSPGSREWVPCVGLNTVTPENGCGIKTGSVCEVCSTVCVYLVRQRSDLQWLTWMKLCGSDSATKIHLSLVNLFSFLSSLGLWLVPLLFPSHNSLSPFLSHLRQCSVFVWWKVELTRWIYMVWPALA